MSYVLRYGGELEGSARECNSALSLDPGNFGFRSCGQTFMQLGDIPRAIDFVRLDSGSEWADATLARLYARQGDIAQAKAFKSGQNPRSRILAACLNNQPSSTISRLAAELSPDALSIPDPEVSYVLAFDYSYCGQNDIAMKLLRKSVAGPYCAATALQRDPGLAKLRTFPEYAEILAEAARCRDTFLSQRRQPLPAATPTPARTL